MPDPNPGYDPRHPHHQYGGKTRRSGQVDDSIDWRLWLKLFWILVIAPINIFIGASLLGYDFNIEENKLISISKEPDCRIQQLEAGPFVDERGVSVEIPQSGQYRVCYKSFIWRAE